MGGAVVVPRRNAFSSSSQHNLEIKDKLSETQSAKDKIHYLATKLSEPKEKNTSCENKIEALQKQLDEMRDLILHRDSIHCELHGTSRCFELQVIKELKEEVEGYFCRLLVEYKICPRLWMSNDFGKRVIFTT